MNLYVTTVFFISAISSLEAWGSSKKVKLSDIQTLTLHHGQMTTGRRTKPVPQLQCVGGTGGCGSFVPQVVQCYNRGSDGYDVQWECKTDMDNAYRFGRVDVICEGYDYPDDPYVLKGSCGLEYTIDLTEEGLKRKGHGHHDYYGSPGSSYGYQQHHTSYKPKQTWFSDGLFIMIVLLVIYAIYRTCLRNHQYSTTSEDYDDPSNRFGSGFGGYGQPPPPGFRTDSYGSGADCGASTMGPSAGAGNFWTGAAAGGILGYMFGNRNRDYYGRSYEPRGSYTSSWGSSSSPDSSTGTRTASGFGGTRRR